MSTSPSEQPEFSVSTLEMGDIFTSTPSATNSFKVYNRHDKILSIASISLRGGSASPFRLNVDGEAGRSFSNIEIRPNDSIYIFVETTVPPSGDGSYQPFDVTDQVDFLTSGLVTSVNLKARACDVEDVKDFTVTGDMRWDSHPRRVYGTLIIPEGASLTVGPGVSIYFHSGASMDIAGKFVTLGQPDTQDASNMVTMRGDRLDNVVTNSPFDLLASQWDGVTLRPSGTMSLSHTDLRGTSRGIEATGDSSGKPTIVLLNSRLHRSGANLLTVKDALLTATGCEFSDSRGSLLSISGGEAQVTHCTFANFYISSYDVGYLVEADASVPAKVRIDNSILVNFRNSLYISPADLSGTDILVRNTLMSVSGTDDSNFIGCIWDNPPAMMVDLANYIYDYRLAPGSPGIDSGNPEYVTSDAAKDMYGVTRHSPRPTLGAYEMN